jgi:hypothetical protein
MKHSEDYIKDLTTENKDLRELLKTYMLIDNELETFKKENRELKRKVRQLQEV